MKVENIGVVPPAVNSLRIKIAENYHDTAEMAKEGKRIEEQGAGILIAGLGCMLVGGSIDALAGKRDQVYGVGRLVWGTGVALSTAGTARLFHGDYIDKAGKNISTAIRAGRAVIKG